MLWDEVIMDVVMMDSTGFKRADRVSDLIKTEMSTILLREIRDPRIRNITITGVKMSDDLRSAKVFFVPLGQETCSDEILEGLRKASRFLRRELGKKLRLRFVPELKFVYDKSFEYGDRIDRLLKDIQGQHTTDDRQDN
jgi:ribosome-binding factor A